MTVEHGWGVIDGEVMAHGMFHTWQVWSIAACIHSLCTIQYYHNSGLAYPDLYGPHWTNSSPAGGVAVFISHLKVKARMTDEHVWVWLKVKPQLVTYSKPVLHGPCTIQLSHVVNGIVYVPACMILLSTLMMIGNQLDDNGSCLGCGCKHWSCDSWLVTQLSDMVHVPSNTPTTVGYNIHTCMDLIGSLPHLVEVPFSSSIRKWLWQLSISQVRLEVSPWLVCTTALMNGSCSIQHSSSSGIAYWVTSSPVRNTIFKLDQKTRMTAEHVLGIVGDESTTHGMFHTYYTWYMHCPILIQ